MPTTGDEEICGISADVLLDRGYGARLLVVVLDSVPYALTTSPKGSAKYVHKAEPVVLDETEPRLFEFRDCMREKWPGIRIGFCSINEFTDAHHYRRLGLPMLILGVEGEGSHEANESVRLDSLFEYEYLLADYLFWENALLKACRKGHWHDAEVKVHGDQLVITHEDA